jgi:hypothetical protein
LTPSGARSKINGVVRDSQASLTRRRLLQLGAGGVVALTAGGVPAVAASALSGPRHLRREVYEGLVGQRFGVLTPGAGGRKLRLLEVGDYGGRAPALRHLAGRPDAFTLLFHGPESPRLASEVHRLSHPRLGRFELLLTPSGTVRGGQDYSVVVNRIRDTRVLEAKRHV